MRRLRKVSNKTTISQIFTWLTTIYYLTICCSSVMITTLNWGRFLCARSSSSAILEIQNNPPSLKKISGRCLQLNWVIVIIKLWPSQSLNLKSFVWGFQIRWSRVLGARISLLRTEEQVTYKSQLINRSSNNRHWRTKLSRWENAPFFSCFFF